MLLASQTLGAAQALTPVLKPGIIAPIAKTITGLLLYASLQNVAGGTTADFYVQTDFGDGQFWDVANFHFTTTNGEALFNLSADAAITTQVAVFTSGAIAANTANAGFIGSRFRVLYATTGTYTAGLVTIFGLLRAQR